MTYDQHRRSIRRELHMARVKDGASMDAGRYGDDARELDRRMVAAGFEVKVPTIWGMSQSAWNARQTHTIDAGATIATSDDPECQPEPWELLC